MRILYFAFYVFFMFLFIPVWGNWAKQGDTKTEPLLLPLLLSIPGLDDGLIYGLVGGAVGIGEGDYTLLSGVSGGGLQGGGLVLIGPGFTARSELNIFAAHIASTTLLNSFTRGLEDADFIRQQLSVSALGFNYEYNFNPFLALNLSTLLSQLNFDSYQNISGDEIISGGRIRPATTLMPGFNLGLDFTDARPSLTSGAKFNFGADFLLPDKPVLGTQLNFSYGYTQYVLLGSPLITLVLAARRSDASVVDTSSYDTPEKIRDAFVKDLCQEITESRQLQECEELEQQIVDFTLATNKQGVATPVGGVTGGRGFTLFRFKAAHTALEVVELRWNISPIFISKPEPLLYLTFFYDWAHAHDQASQLYEQSANSYGGGLLITLIEDISLRLEYAQSIEESFLYFTLGSNW